MQNMILEHSIVFFLNSITKSEEAHLSSEPLNPMLYWYTKQSGPVDMTIDLNPKKFKLLRIDSFIKILS